MLRVPVDGSTGGPVSFTLVTSSVLPAVWGKGKPNSSGSHWDRNAAAEAQRREGGKCKGAVCFYFPGREKMRCSLTLFRFILKQRPFCLLGSRAKTVLRVASPGGISYTLRRDSHSRLDS